MRIPLVHTPMSRPVQIASGVAGTGLLLLAAPSIASAVDKPAVDPTVSGSPQSGDGDRPDTDATSVGAGIGPVAGVKVPAPRPTQPAPSASGDDGDAKDTTDARPRNFGDVVRNMLHMLGF